MIALIPLDERPCNTKFPFYISAIGGLELKIPPKDILSLKRKPANLLEVEIWIEEIIDEIEALILSIDMWIYGGLIPSRISNITLEEAKKRLLSLRKLKTKLKEKPLYAFNVIMRISNSNNNEEEKEYWKDYGPLIFRYSELFHKVRVYNKEEDIKALEEIKSYIPKDILEDYLEGRRRNFEINKLLIELVSEGTVDFALLTQDDASPFGFPAMEQAELRNFIRDKKVQSKVLIYPGADEVGMLLLARYMVKKFRKTPLFYIRYSSVKGPFMIMNYEDRPLAEGIKGQISAVSAIITDNLESADIALMVNTPSQAQGEAYLFYNQDKVEGPERNILELCEFTNYCLSCNKITVLGDVAYANGADPSLIELLKELKILNCIHGYAGWNTAGNTLGTVISVGIASSLSKKQNLSSNYIPKFLYYRLVDDWLYQANVRTSIIEALKSQGKNPWNLENVGEVREVVKKMLINKANEELNSLFPFRVRDVNLPWNRLFEVDLEIE